MTHLACFCKPSLCIHKSFSIWSGFMIISTFFLIYHLKFSLFFSPSFTVNIDNLISFIIPEVDRREMIFSVICSSMYINEDIYNEWHKHLNHNLRASSVIYWKSYIHAVNGTEAVFHNVSFIYTSILSPKFTSMMFVNIAIFLIINKGSFVTF